MENLPPMYDDNTIGIAGLGSDYDSTGAGFPNPVDIAKNVAKQKAIEYGVSKLGLPSVLGTVLGSNTLISNPLGLAAFGPAGLGISALAGANANIQSSLFGRSATIADYLQAKRNEKIRNQVANRGAMKQNRELSDRLSKAPVDDRDAYRGGQYQGGGGGGMSSNASTGTSSERGAALHG
jgi:hypothetical protein|tara:strand:+ start:400 stop:939 length:540 start_codon:yes stop_codon:yes gene_type:complete